MRKKHKSAKAEYQLIISKTKAENDRSFLFTLQTVKEFWTYQYLITVETEILKKQIRFDIKGLQTPRINLPNSGPATFSREIPQLKGKYDIVVSKPGGEEYCFQINVRGKSVTVREAPEHRFVEVILQV